jgi:hypothetical protein
MKALYRHKKSGDLFAIETDGAGDVIATSGPLLFSDLDPKLLDYDDYWNSEIAAKLADFERLKREDYLEILRKEGFYRQESQRHLFD